MYCYPFWARIYTFWWFLVFSAFFYLGDLYWIKSEAFYLGYGLIVVIFVVQYFVTEHRAKYWPVSVNLLGLCFYEREVEHQIKWSSIVQIRKFPTINFMPPEWSEAMFSSGIIIRDSEKGCFVVYRKINGFEEILKNITRQTGLEAS